MTSNQAGSSLLMPLSVPFLIGDTVIGVLEPALFELNVADHHLIFVDPPLNHAVNRGDFHHFQAQIAELMRGKKRAVRPAECHPRDARLCLQLRQEDELALIRLACLKNILNKQRADRSMRGARLGGDRVEFLFDRGNDLLVDRRCKCVAVRFRCPPPQYVDTDRAHHDRCKDKSGNCEANANPHEDLRLLLGKT